MAAPCRGQHARKVAGIQHGMRQRKGEKLVLRILENQAHMLSHFVGVAFKGVFACNSDFTFEFAVVEVGD